MFYYDQETETASRADIEKIQLMKLQKMLSKIYRKNKFYRKKFEQHGVIPAQIRSLQDIKKLPFTEKKELQQDQEKSLFGTNITEPFQNYIQYHQTTGTTGRPLRWLDTKESWEWRARCIAHAFKAAGLDERDTLFLPFNFGPYSAFWGAYEAAQHLGLLTIPGGGWSSEQRLKGMVEAQATALATTPTYALRLLETAQKINFNIAASRIRVIILAGEPGAMIPAVRSKLEEGWQAKVFEYPGLTEVGTYAFQCSERQDAIHLIESEFIIEVIDPDTGQEVSPGRLGELVITNLGRSCSPVIRFRTNDLVKIGEEHCSCGRTFRTLEGGVLGRRDEMVIIRGVNIFPSTISNIVQDILSPEEEYQIAAYREGNSDQLGIRVETSRKEVVDQLVKSIKEKLNLRVNVFLVEWGRLPRYDYKAKRFVDERNSLKKDFG